MSKKSMFVNRYRFNLFNADQDLLEQLDDLARQLDTLLNSNVLDQDNIDTDTVGGKGLMKNWVSPPESETSPGKPGQLAFDEDYLYWCAAEDLWGRIARTW